MRRLLLLACLFGCANPDSFDPPGLARAALTLPVVDDPSFPDQWQLHHDGPFTTRDGKGEIEGDDHAHVAEAWALILRLGLADDVTAIGQDVRLGIIDDGFDLAHEDLADKYVASKNFGGPVEAGNLYASSPANFHGTLTTGIAAASVNNGVGIAGACPGCKLVVARIGSEAGDGSEAPADYYARVFTWLLAQDPDVLNLSFGPDRTAARATLDAVIARVTDEGRGALGSVVVAAAGNSGEDFAWNAFTDSERTLAVGGASSEGLRFSFSNYGAGLDLLAPTSGGEKRSVGFGSVYVDRIWSTDNYQAPACLDPGEAPSSGCSDSAGWTPQRAMAGGDGWVGKYSYRFSHTSAAAPLVTGIVGLVLHVAPTLTRAEITRVLRASADRVQPGDADYDARGFSVQYGYGRVNALRAVALAHLAQGGELSPELKGEIDALSPCTRADCWDGTGGGVPPEPAHDGGADPRHDGGVDPQHDGGVDAQRDGGTDLPGEPETPSPEQGEESGPIRVNVESPSSGCVIGHPTPASRTPCLWLPLALACVYPRARRRARGRSPSRT